MSATNPYRELFERSADCLLIIEGDRFVDCNAAAVEMFGASDRSQMLTVHPSDLSPPQQPDGSPSFEKANEMIRIAFEAGSHRFEWDHMRLGGEVFEAEVLLTAINEPGRRVLHSVVRDISERKRLEAELRQAQKMEAVGKLAGGIAHDFNNLLLVMLGSCDLLDLHRLEPQATEHVRDIRSAGEKAAALTRQLLTFSRKQEVREETLDLGEVVDDLMGMLGRIVGEHIELDVRVERSSWVHANRHRVEQVVLNLVSNAQDAMPGGGHLTVAVSRADSDKLGRVAQLRVTDDGVGMTPDVLSRAFEPFFTTKPMGDGTGLGLATVYTIVEQTRGEVLLESSPGRGTSVRVQLPLVDPPQQHAHPGEVVEPRVGTETIVVVEDDPAIRRLTEILLTTSGFRVLSAANGEEGLALVEAHADEVSLIMTDVVMPRVGGPEMMLRLRERGIRTPVLFMSGYTDATLEQLSVLPEKLDVVEKPFNLKLLASRVRAAIDRGPVAAN